MPPSFFLSFLHFLAESGPRFGRTSPHRIIFLTCRSTMDVIKRRLLLLGFLFFPLFPPLPLPHCLGGVCNTIECGRVLCILQQLACGKKARNALEKNTNSQNAKRKSRPCVLLWPAPVIVPLWPISILSRQLATKQEYYPTTTTTLILAILHRTKPSPFFFSPSTCLCW